MIDVNNEKIELSEIDIERIENISLLLSQKDFSGAKLLFNRIIGFINKQNFIQNLEVIKKSIDKGRELRVIIDSKDEGDRLLENLGIKEKAFSSSDMDEEAKLIVYIGQSIINQLELDNMYLNNEKEVEDILDELNAFVDKNAFGDWFDEDDLNWREKNVKKN